MSMLMKGMARLALGLWLFFGSCNPAPAQSVVCRRQSIYGFPREYDQAKKILPHEPTTKLEDCVVYVAKKGEDYYLHSNFRSAVYGEPGEYHENPTKIATSETGDLTTL